MKYIMVIPDADKAGANTYINSNMSVTGDAFTIGLSSDGSGPATHFWTSLRHDDFASYKSTLETTYNVVFYDTASYTKEQVLSTESLTVLDIYTDPTP